MRTDRYDRLAALMLGCLLVSACGGEDGTYDVSLEEAKAKLGNAVQEYNESGDGQTIRSVRGIGWQGDTLRVEVNSGHENPIIYNCSVVAESVDESTTRLTPDCAQKIEGGQEMLNELVAVEIGEFVSASMNDRAMDARKIQRKAAGLVLANKQDIQAQAEDGNLQYHEDRQRQNDGGWGSDSSSASGDGGWGKK